jgi:hypothetical protein
MPILVVLICSTRIARSARIAPRFTPARFAHQAAGQA